MADYGDLAYTLAGYKKKDSPYDTRRRFGQQMTQQGMDFSPVQHPMQGVARLANALVGAWMMNSADSAEKEAQDARAQEIDRISGIADPQERVAAMGKLDPELGLRIGGQLAVEQAKIQEARRSAGEGAGTIAGLYNMPMPGQGGQPTPLQPMPQQAGAMPQGTPQGFDNNVGNIRVSPAQWQGQGAPHNGFVTFDTPEAGARAMFQNLQAYTGKNPNMTVGQAIATWAPPSENNTQAYIGRIAQAGIDPNMPLAQVLRDPQAAGRLMMTMGVHEKGRLPQGFTPDTFVAAAGGQIPQGSGPQAAPGMPPAPSPQGINGPAIVAPTPTEIPRPPADPEVVQRAYTLRNRGGISDAEMVRIIESDRDRRWQLAQTQAGEDRRTAAQIAGEQRREAMRLAADAAKEGMPGKPEMEKYRQAQTDAAVLNRALDDYAKEFPGRKLTDLTGASSPRNTAYYNAALMAKSQALFDLGVLNGPDLDVIRKTLPDPSTFAGQFSSDKSMEAAVAKVRELVNTRLAAKAQALGLSTDTMQLPISGQSGAPGAPRAGGVPPPPPGFRPL